jgi:hypothetical protein
MGMALNLKGVDDAMAAKTGAKKAAAKKRPYSIPRISTNRRDTIVRRRRVSWRTLSFDRQPSS